MYTFNYKGMQVNCIPTFGKEFDIVINDKLIATEFRLLPWVKDIDFENFITEILQNKNL